jgi:hypothetical protein
MVTSTVTRYRENRKEFSYAPTEHKTIYKYINEILSVYIPRTKLGKLRVGLVLRRALSNARIPRCQCLGDDVGLYDGLV